MLKFFYRLKRRHGVVLFAVIAIMTLLIAMATTAYFTARASYQTVVSNYDFSQTYLSAISISDMLIEAVTQDTSHPGTDNSFDDLKKAVQNLRDNKTAGAADAVITGYTVHNGTAATDANILTQAASYPVEAGIFDAAKVEIKYVKKEPVPDNFGNPTEETRHYFTFTTTVYYRDTTISVQDTIINTSGSKSNEDASPFNRFFTATSQTAGGHGSRVVVIDTKDISDDSYFENDYTVIGLGETASQKIDGSIVSSGSVYMYKTDTSGIGAPNANDRNDWFIGKDLVLTRNADSLNLHGNNLYIGGDLIIARGGSGLINAANIYVKGNIYYIGSGSGATGITGDVYLGGTVSNSAAAVQARINELEGYLSYQGYSTNLLSLGDNSNPFSYTNAGTWDDSTLISVSNPEIVSLPSGGKTYQEKVTTGITLGDAFKDKTMPRSYSNYSADAATYKNELNINPSAISAADNVVTMDELTDPGDYRSHGSGVIDTSFYDNSVPPYGANVNAHYEVVDGKIHYTKTLQSTGELLESGVYTSSGNIVTFEYDDGSTLEVNKSTKTARIDASEGGGATIKKESDGRITVDVDYNPDGYLLGITGAPSNGKITYNFGTVAGETMPVVLKANCNDSSGTPVDGDGKNAFSWIGVTDKGGENGDKTFVQLTPDATGKYGNVAFEIGSYTKKTDPESGEETMKYVPYVRDNDNALNVPTYYETQDMIVGTQSQVNYLKNKDLMNDPQFEGMLESGKNYAQEQYKNHVMIISNKNEAKNQGVAINGNLSNHALCGYIYAPNGAYEVHASSPRRSVFGGMIVSVYDTKHSYFTFCSPDPDDIKSILSKLHEEEFHTDPVPTEGVWSYQQGKNYLG